MSLLAYERFGQHLLGSCVLLIGMGWDLSTLVETHFVPSLAHGLHIQMDNLSSLEWDGIGPYMFS